MGKRVSSFVSSFRGKLPSLWLRATWAVFGARWLWTQWCTLARFDSIRFIASQRFLPPSLFYSS